MNNKFDRVSLIGRQHTKGAVHTLETLIMYLQAKHVAIVLEHETAKMLSTVELPVVDRDQLDKYCDLIIVVGGDGSLLSASHTAADLGIPVLGVNRGQLGFLTDICPDEIDSIGKILRGDYIAEERFLLKATIEENGTTAYEQSALNDVVLLPGEINRMIEFTIFINDQFVCSNRADGLIVATPTGSTAHALSGGGPILHPGLDAIVLLPMFPHTLSSRPIVVHGNSDIEIVMAKHSKGAPNISCDGQKLTPIADCAKIHVKKHANKLKLIHLTDYNYYETLRAKLHWENVC